MSNLHFRVWDKHDQVMGQQFIKDICAEDGTMFKAVAFTFGNGKIVTLAEAMGSERYVVMRGSGLNDTSGREIFEADVLDGGSLDDYWCVIEWVFAGLQIVTHVKAGADVRGISDGVNQGYLEEGEEAGLTIVGNLHENPGLLASAPADE